MRKKIIAANWKMNNEYSRGLQLAAEVVNKINKEVNNDTFTILLTPFIHINSVYLLVKGSAKVAVGAQNCHEEASGAYTGEVSAAMIKSVGGNFVIIGHSERRTYFGETDIQLAKKVDTALLYKLHPIYCCGETLEERENNKHFETVEKQIKTALFHLSEENVNRLIIAYEPVWAIGTGKTATPDQAQEMHAFIRGQIAAKYGEQVADQISLLYGGSVKAANAVELFGQPDVDGGLVGGASLVAEEFVAIINALT